MLKLFLCDKITNSGEFMAEYNFYISPANCKESSKDALRGSWKQSAGITSVYAVIMLVLIATTTLLSVFVKWWISIPLGLFVLLFGGILNFGLNKYFLFLAQGKQTQLSMLFSGFSKKFGAILKLTFKRLFLSLFWLAVMVFPFFVKSIGYSMSTFLMIDRNDINGSNALQESKHLMKNNYARYFKFLLSFLGWFLLGALTAGIGFLWIIPMFITNKAVFYENLKTDF